MSEVSVIFSIDEILDGSNVEIALTENRTDVATWFRVMVRHRHRDSLLRGAHHGLWLRGTHHRLLIHHRSVVGHHCRLPQGLHRNRHGLHVWSRGGTVPRNRGIGAPQVVLGPFARWRFLCIFILLLLFQFLH